MAGSNNRIGSKGTKRSTGSTGTTNNNNSTSSGNSSNTKGSLFLASLPSRHRKRRHQSTLFQSSSLSSLSLKKTKHTNDRDVVAIEPVVEQQLGKGRQEHELPSLVTSNNIDNDNNDKTKSIDEAEAENKVLHKDNNELKEPLVKVKLENDKVSSRTVWRKEKHVEENESEHIYSTALSTNTYTSGSAGYEHPKFLDNNSSSSSLLSKDDYHPKMTKQERVIQHDSSTRRNTPQSINNNYENEYKHIETTNVNKALTNVLSSASISKSTTVNDDTLLAPLPPSPLPSSSTSSPTTTHKSSTNNLTEQLQQLVSSHVTSLLEKCKQYQTENKKLKEQLSMYQTQIEQRTIQEENEKSKYHNECKSLQRQVCSLQNELKMKCKFIYELEGTLKNQNECFIQYKEEMNSWLYQMGFRFGNSNGKGILTKVVQLEVTLPPSLSHNITITNQNINNTRSSAITNIAAIKNQNSHPVNDSSLPTTHDESATTINAISTTTHTTSIVENQSMNLMDSNENCNKKGIDNYNVPNDVVQQTEDIKNSNEIMMTSKGNDMSINNEESPSTSISNQNSYLKFTCRNHNNHDVISHNNDDTQGASIRFELGVIDDGKDSSSSCNSNCSTTNGCDDVSSCGNDTATDTQQHFEQTNASEVYDFSCAFSKKSPVPTDKSKFNNHNITNFVTPAARNNGGSVCHDNSSDNNKGHSNIVTNRKNSVALRSDDNVGSYEKALYGESCPSPIIIDKKLPIRDVSNNVQLHERDGRLKNERSCQKMTDTKNQREYYTSEPKQVKMHKQDPLSSSKSDNRVDKEMNKQHKNKIKYQEVVRGKKAREALNGYFCEECNEFANAICDHPGGDVFDRKMFTTCSRHRGQYSPAQTPDDFWELSFIDERNEKAAAAAAAEKEESGNM